MPRIRLHTPVFTFLAHWLGPTRRVKAQGGDTWFQQELTCQGLGRRKQGPRHSQATPLRARDPALCVVLVLSDRRCITNPRVWKLREKPFPVGTERSAQTQTPALPSGVSFAARTPRGDHPHSTVMSVT